MNPQLTRTTRLTTQCSPSQLMIEKYGSGIARIIKAFDKYGLKRPRFSELGEGFMVTVFSTPLKTPPKTPLKTPLEGLTKLERKIFEQLAKDRAISTPQIARKLNLSADTVKEYINKLKKKSFVKRIGPARGGYWEVLPDILNQ